MRIRFALASILVFLASTSLYAQQKISANVPFDFIVAGKVLPAGNYDFVRSPDERSIRVSGGKESAVALVLSRLAAGMHTTPKDAHVIFDKLNDQYFLSEVWMTNMDGFDLHNAPEKHEHKILNVPVQ